MRCRRRVPAVASYARRCGRAQRGVDELVGGDGVLALLRLAQRVAVDALPDLVDEVPLLHRALDGPDLVLRVRVEVEAQPLAVGAVVGAAQLDRQLDRL